MMPHYHYKNNKGEISMLYKNTTLSKITFSLIITTLAVFLFFAYPANAEFFYCETSEEIQGALDDAKPGDEIVIAPGKYEGDKNSNPYQNGFFEANNDGTASEPIIVRSENPNDPAVLTGREINYGYGLYITGNHWEFRNLAIKTAQKGIMLDGGNHNLIYKCEVSNIGDEGVHFRDGSSGNTIERSRVYNTGNYQPSYGEGIYVSSAISHWNSYEKKCDDNLISENIIGPDVTAEHIDIKEGTIGTIVEYNFFYGEGISGEHYAENLVDVKGNEAIIRYNVGFREDNEEINMAFKNLGVEEGWGLNNKYYGNTINLNSEEPYLITNWEGSATAWGNRRLPAGNMYEDNIIIEEENLNFGDVNSDDKISSTDLAYLKRHLTGTIDFTLKNRALADMNGDVEVNSLDCTLLQRYLIGEIHSFVQ
jgi:parallel beta-helix repeat protein